MSVTLEEFATTLIKTLIPRPGHPTGYVLAGNLASAIQIALVPPDQQGQADYPRMLYKGPWDAEQTLIVNSCEEEMAAVGQGWSRTSAPRPWSYPQQWCEVEPARGSDYRRVMVRNATEEKLFGEVTDSSKWVRDDTYQLAGRPCGLDEIVNERRGTLHRLLDEEFQQNPTMAETEAPPDFSEER